MWFVFCFKIKDILRDCRKSQIMAILAISHVMKSITYKHQIHRFRVFRQSLRISLKRETCDIIPIFDDITTFLWVQKPLISWSNLEFWQDRFFAYMLFYSIYHFRPAFLRAAT